MAKIAIQVGHQNIQFNSIPALRNSTGATDEMNKNLRIGNRVSEILRSKGFEVKQTDANANSDPSVISTDWDLFLSLHCDANYEGNEGGGFIDFPDPSVDSSTIESKRIKEAIESEYFNHSGIRNVPTRSNPNTKFYYMWNYLTAKTPCCLLEMGESVDPHDSVILADTERVASAIARGICKAFFVIYDPPIPPSLPVPTPAVDYKSYLVEIKQISNEKTILWPRLNQSKRIKQVLVKSGI